jgi:hypothetical protein
MILPGTRVPVVQFIFKKKIEHTPGTRVRVELTFFFCDATSNNAHEQHTDRKIDIKNYNIQQRTQMSLVFQCL